MSRWQIHSAAPATRAARTFCCDAAEQFAPSALAASFPYFSISSIDAPRARSGGPIAPRSACSRVAREFIMANKMIIDASHPEETRVVVLRGNRVEEFDFESASKRPLRGNIYLAKVTRVEPSLQAAFIDYGGNRHGFLAFSEIHPDYYQIPVADRQALLEEEALSQREEDEETNSERRSRRHRHPRRQGVEARAEHSETISEAAPRRSSAGKIRFDVAYGQPRRGLRDAEADVDAVLAGCGFGRVRPG